MARELWEGNQAIAEAAVRAGLEGYFGYPITPQNEILEWLSKRMPELGRAFVQAEAELGAINMVYGAACTGARVMTSSSSPGISLMMEGLSYIAGTEVPMLLVNVMRGGPGLGNIAPSQGDYNQICKGGGHGDYHPIVLAPSSVQEAVDLVPVAFDLAEKYLNIVCILLDGSIGQMMEPVQLPPMAEVRRRNFPWAPRRWRAATARRWSTSRGRATDRRFTQVSVPLGRPSSPSWTATDPWTRRNSPDWSPSWTAARTWRSGGAGPSRAFGGPGTPGWAPRRCAGGCAPAIGCPCTTSRRCASHAARPCWHSTSPTAARDTRWNS